jgi:hypothetical protein
VLSGSHCNVPKAICKECHGFGCLFKTFTGCGILSNTLLTVTLRDLLMIYMCVCSNKQEDTIMEHTPTICKINKMIDKPKHCRSDLYFITINKNLLQ